VKEKMMALRFRRSSATCVQPQSHSKHFPLTDV
jgi:hypothetical protein